MTRIPDPFYNKAIQALTDSCVISFIASIGAVRLGVISINSCVTINLFIMVLFLLICIYNKIEQFLYLKSKSER